MLKTSMCGIMPPLQWGPVFPFSKFSTHLSVNYSQRQLEIGDKPCVLGTAVSSHEYCPPCHWNSPVSASPSKPPQSQSHSPCPVSRPELARAKSPALQFETHITWSAAGRTRALKTKL